MPKHISISSPSFHVPAASVFEEAVTGVQVLSVELGTSSESPELGEEIEEIQGTGEGASALIISSQ